MNIEMEKSVVNEVELEYSILGKKEGEPIIFIHGGIIADANIPLFLEPSLKNYRLVHYRRRGYAGSSKDKLSISISEQALDCKNLLDYLEINHVHIVGHSVGGTIALQFTLEYPHYVNTISLLEPALTGYGQDDNYEVIEEFMPMIELYDKGQKQKAIDIFMRNTIGNDYLKLMEERLPVDAYDLAVIDAKTYFHYEIPSMKEWKLPFSLNANIPNIDNNNNSFNLNTERPFSKPVLYARGADSGQRAKEREQVISNLFPNTRIFVVENAKHMLQIMNPSKVAEGIATILEFQ
jgi:pimeloyl-ACP methyl ester carboxylesterase